MYTAKRLKGAGVRTAKYARPFLCTRIFIKFFEKYPCSLGLLPAFFSQADSAVTDRDIGLFIDVAFGFAMSDK